MLRCVAALLLSMLVGSGHALSAGQVLAATGTSGLTLSTAAITQGRLVITGTAASPGTVVALEGTPFRATADAQRRFSFSLDYRTPDCRVTLRTSTGTLAVLIGQCGPGTVPRGAWSGVAQYRAGDLALYGGSTYRALRANVGKAPALNAADWQLFAARGATGPQGPAGPAGSAGAEFLAVHVAADGALLRGRGVSSVEKPGEGAYTVTFQRDLSLCFATATPSASMYTLGLTVSSNVVSISIRRITLAGMPADDSSFFLTVLCPP